MKLCASCKTEKATSEFHKRAKAKDGLQYVCKACNREQRKAYFQTANGNAKNKLSGTKWRIQMRAKLYEYLLTHPCEGCGEKDPVVLEFDHLDPATKTGHISALVRRGCGWQKILEEIEKCRVLCANCHRRRTAIQFGWFKVVPTENYDISTSAL